jgi:pimeloyl-ACP methyl ester carboxylesterase
MIADPRKVDDMAVYVQEENVRRARFRIGDIPASDVLLRALSRVAARVSAVYGGNDAFAKANLQERRRLLAALRPELDFRLIDHAGHWAIYEAAEEVNGALLQWLAHG